MPRYEALPHTADTGIIAYGATLAEVFENAAFGMFDLMFDVAQLPGGRDLPVVASGDTVEELLVAWLGELLYLAEANDLALVSFSVDRLEEGGIQGVASGSPTVGAELRGAPIKAVTYHDLAVVEVPAGYWARVLFDV